MKSWKKFIGCFAFILAIAGLSACGGSSSDTASNTPPVINPPDNGGGGGGGGTPQPPPPPTMARLSFSYEFCSDDSIVTHPAVDIQVEPSLGWWRNNKGQGSYDSFIIRNPVKRMINGGTWTCYGPIQMERPHDENWQSRGNLYVAVSIGDNEGNYPYFANIGMPKFKAFYNGRDNPFITVSLTNDADVFVEADWRTAHNLSWPQPDGSLDWGGAFLDDCNGGDKNCASGGYDDIEDDGYTGVRD